MDVDMVADMEVHMVVDNMVADMVATTVFERGFAQLQWMAATYITSSKNPIAIYFQAIC